MNFNPFNILNSLPLLNQLNYSAAENRFDKFNTFLATTGLSGISRPERFEVEVYPPANIKLKGVTEHLKLVCESVEIPSQTVSTAEYRVNSNPVIPIPHDFSFGNTINLTFRLSTDLRERNIMLLWQDAVYKPGLGFGYYNDYIGTIIVKAMNMANEVQQEFVFRNCFPTAIQELQYSWENSSSYMKQGVSFSFFVAEIGLGKQRATAGIGSQNYIPDGTRLA